ncbi:uncharacterized protein isoform X1 [Musca autumnalis]|uniref:uncharacterized protein isoform X1 n=1 Tax=Musca autumnalis TaxID=221902 RepID=UPI003CED24EE
MMITKSRIHKLLLITLVICCLTTAVNGAKITTKNKTKSVSKDGDDVITTTTVKSEVVAANTTNADNTENDSDEDIDDDDAAEKNAVQSSSDESLFSVWGIVRGVLNWIKDDISAGLFDADDDAAAEKTAATDVSKSKVWGMVNGVWNWIKDDISAGLFSADDDSAVSAVAEGRSDGSVEARTFGKIRRLQMALIPIIFKFGVLTAMVAFLVGIGLKTLFLVKVLLAMNALALLGKFFTLKTHFAPQIQYSAPPSWSPHVEYSAPPSWSWSPVQSSGGWSSAPVHDHGHEHEHHPSKEIHLHIHGAQAQSQPKAETYTAYVASPSASTSWQRSDPYSAYEPNQNNDITVEATKSIPISLSTDGSIPANHRMF